MAHCGGRQPAAPEGRDACRSASTAPQHRPRRQQCPRTPAARLRPAAALPPDALEALPTAAAAAAASLLTAAWLRRPAGESDSSAAEQQVPPAAPAPQQEPELPGSPEAVWAVAWQGFAPPQPAAAAAAGTGTAAGPEQQAGSAGSASGTSSQPLEAGVEEEEAPELQQASLQRSPVLLLEGIRAADRSRLLALCLAALESQVAALPAAPGLLAAGQAQWRQLAAALLALSSVAAAAAWLGYVPARLLEAAAAQLAAADAAVLQTAGLQAEATALQQQAAAARSGSKERAQEDAEGSPAVAWYCLEEKLQLYSSVLRLLSCAIIEQQQQQRMEAAALGLLGAPGSASGSSDSEDALAAAGSDSSSSGDLVRRQARSLLQQQQQAGDSAAGGGIRGWRATAAGTRSETQLLALAPAALQDMAVTAADAVAAAYLADAAAAGPSAVVRQEAAAAAAAGDFMQADAAAGTAAAAQQGQQQQELQLGTQQGAVPALRTTDGSTGSSGSSSSAGGEAASTAPRPLEAGWWPTYVHRQLGSTRQLQRFANGVALQRWLYKQYRGVVDIYEDRLQLWAISGGGRRLEAARAPMKRTPELGRLSGLRYAASLLLEAADLLMPLLCTLWRQATSAASWLLVRLVGQAVTLVRRGVQQGSSQAGAAAAGKAQPRTADRQQQRRRQRQRRPREEGDGSQPGWAWEG